MVGRFSVVGLGGVADLAALPSTPFASVQVKQGSFELALSLVVWRGSRFRSATAAACTLGFCCS